MESWTWPHCCLVTPLRAKGRVLLQDAHVSGQFQLPLHRIEQQKPQESEWLVLLEGVSCAFRTLQTCPYSAIFSSEDPNRSGWHQNIQDSKMPPLQKQKLYGSNPNAQTQTPWDKQKNQFRVTHVIPDDSCNQGFALQRVESTAQGLVQTYPHTPNMSQFLWAQVPIDPATSALFHQPQLCPVSSLWSAAPANKGRGNHGKLENDGKRHWHVLLSLLFLSIQLYLYRWGFKKESQNKKNNSSTWSTPSVACSTSAPRFPGRSQVETLGSPIVVHMRESPQGFSWAGLRPIAASTRIEGSDAQYARTRKNTTCCQ